MIGYRNISSFSVIVAFIALALLGCALIPLMPVKLSPSETLPSMSVSYSMPGSAVRIVETEATSRLEAALTRVSGIKNIKSRSWSGGGRITLELDRNANMETARFEAAMIVRQIWGELPSNMRYPVISVQQVDDDAARPFICYTINSDRSPAEIMRYSENNISPVLSRITGVAKVELSGANPMEWRVEYDNRQMSALGITASQVSTALSSYFSTEFLGVALIDSKESGDDWVRLSIANTDNIGALDLSKIVVTNHHGKLITLDKVATVIHIEASPTGYFRINGLNSIYLNITAADDANQIDLSKRIRNAISEMSLPAGYMLDLRFDSSENISKELSKIYLRTALTIVILLLFVLLITRNWRYLLLVAIGLAINIAIAFVVYYLLNVEIQLYSLAGITISLNLIIDNLIVITEHITRRRNLRAFTAVLAATFTTIGALSVVFFLDEKTMLSLKDFVIVVIVNLCVSLLVALFLVPALVERLGVSHRNNRKPWIDSANHFTIVAYTATIRFLCRRKAIVYIALILLFGLPTFLVPEKINGDSRWATLYNSTIGSQNYKENIRPWVDRCLGGTLRLFAEKVSNGGYFNRGHEEPVVYINATLPNGATLSQMNELIKKMERFVGAQAGVRQFRTSVYSSRRSSISVYFKPDYQKGGYPYQLKSDAIAKALTLGGGSWSVYGLEDQGFNNDVRENAGSYRVKMRGYNYDELFSHAERLRDTLLTHKRIREVVLNSEFSYWKDDYSEFYVEIDKTRLAKDSLSISELYGAINHNMGRDISVGTVSTGNGREAIKLSSREKNNDVWQLMYVPMSIVNRIIKLGDYATIERRQSPLNIIKENQEYILCVQYEYVGSSTQGDKALSRVLDAFEPTLPMGYKAERGTYSWNFGKDAGQYALLALIAVIIFFISSILFNSLKQPLAILVVIPVSFIGVFLTFYLFDLKFDQGGFAAFILLSGITVNAAIYIINEYNLLRGSAGADASLERYIDAFKAKITAVLLTVLSTVLGFIPFLVGDVREGFWFPLAAGTIGGLIMSLVAVVILLPLLLLPRRDTTIK